jgi:hypothetical protein
VALIDVLRSVVWCGAQVKPNPDGTFTIRELVAKLLSNK